MPVYSALRQRTKTIVNSNKQVSALVYGLLGLVRRGAQGGGASETAEARAQRKIKYAPPSQEKLSCPTCNAPSRLLGRADINMEKLKPQPAIEPHIKHFNALGYYEQKVYLCPCCGLVFVRPFPSDDEIVGFEAGERGLEAVQDPKQRRALGWEIPTYASGLTMTWSQAVRAPRISQIIREHFSGPLRLLDVGAHGGVVSLSLDLPEGSAVDLLQADSSFAAQQRPKVRQFRGLLCDLRDQNYTADVILALHVLEHVDSPYAFLSDVRALMSDKGLCVIEVPYEMPDAHATAVNRILSPNHKSFFGPWSLLEAMRLAKLQVVDYEFMDCHSTGYSDYAPKPAPVLRATAIKTETMGPPAYETNYLLARALDSLLGSFAGSLAYLSERPFRLFVYNPEALQLASYFVDRPGFRGFYSSNDQLIDGENIKDVFLQKLDPAEVMVVLERYNRDKIIEAFSAQVEVI